MKNCPVCQKVLSDQAKFCYFCGASLLNDEAPVEVPANEPEPETVEEAIEEPVVSAVEPEPVEAPVEPDPQPFAENVPAKPVEPEPVTVQPEPEPEPKPEPKPAPVEAPVAKEPVVLATDSRSLMTTIGYIFTTILFHIPIIGLIFMIVWGCGKTKNISRKRFSLACLIMRLVGCIIMLSCAVFVLICFSGKFPALMEAVKPILFP